MIFQRKQKKSQHEDIVLRNAILVLSERLDKLKDSHYHSQHQKRQSIVDRFESICKKRDLISRYEISCLIRGIVSETKEHEVDDETKLHRLCISWSKLVLKYKEKVILPYSMMMRELLLYAVAWDSPRTKNSCCCVCNALLSEHVSIRRNAFLLITEHATPFLSELARGQHFRRTKDKFHDAHASHARILAIAMLSSLERVPSLIKWSEDKKIGTFMGGLHQDQTDNMKEEENEELHHDKILEVYLRPGDLVERLAVEDMSRYVKEFCSRISILQFRDSSPELYDRFLVSFLRQVQTHRNTKLLRKPSFQIRSLRRYMGSTEESCMNTK